MDEKDTPTKLEILFKLNLYVLAINLAHMQKYDDTSIAEIFKKYGDHLYQKGDYDGAMEQYIRTIGQLEPSYVIRKVNNKVYLECIVMLIENTVFGRSKNIQLDKLSSRTSF